MHQEVIESVVEYFIQLGVSKIDLYTESDVAYKDLRRYNSAHIKVIQKLSPISSQASALERFQSAFEIILTDHSIPQYDEKLPDAIESSLAREIDVSKSYDVVVDCRSKRQSIGYLREPSLVLNEGILEHGIISSYTDWDELHDQKEILITSNDVYLASEFLEKFSSNLDSKSFHFITSDIHMQSKLKEISPQIMGQVESKFENDIKTFLEQKKQWDQLEDYEKVKIKKPTEPVKLIHFYEGAFIVSLDQLSDQQDLFVSAQLADGELKTFHCPKVVNLNISSTPSYKHNLLLDKYKEVGKILTYQNELGYFQLFHLGEVLGEVINELDSNLMKLFRKEETNV